MQILHVFLQLKTQKNMKKQLPSLETLLSENTTRLSVVKYTYRKQPIRCFLRTFTRKVLTYSLRIKNIFQQMRYETTDSRRGNTDENFFIKK